MRIKLTAEVREKLQYIFEDIRVDKAATYDRFERLTIEEELITSMIQDIKVDVFLNDEAGNSALRAILCKLKSEGY